MNLKTDWKKHLHDFRTRELMMIFDKCSKGTFAKGLELGAGDGFQSKILTNYIQELTATDLGQSELSNNLSKENKEITYQYLDAEKVDESYDKKSFDIVFSSNLMEHLPNFDQSLAGIHKVLKDDGITIHVMPNVWWRFFNTVLHYPDQMTYAIKYLTEPKKKEEVKIQTVNENNPDLNNWGVKRSNFPKIYYRLFPVPHGVSRTVLGDFIEFRKSKWLKAFDKAGFDIVKVKNGPASSGFGFGMDRTRLFLEKIGITTEYIYIAKKKNQPSKYADLFK